MSPTGISANRLELLQIADAVAKDETILLKIDQEGFYELMAGNSEIMREIVKMLAQRLRSMNKEITKH